MSKGHLRKKVPLTGADKHLTAAVSGQFGIATYGQL
ncbi:hypothetical protein QFZ24_009940 [Streptomyces phaeochromogenes]|nr:hypothetical protein [Streptomyces phaeochromogenes]